MASLVGKVRQIIESCRGFGVGLCSSCITRTRMSPSRCDHPLLWARSRNGVVGHHVMEGSQQNEIS